MAGGLAALLDDVAAIAKLAAASVDDIGAAAGRAGVKAAGVVVDDTAVTPRYVTGFTPDRELPIIWRIAKGSLFNKIAIILPVALLLSWLLPWAITPLLMIGGAYLCFEGVEKVWEAVAHKEESLADKAEELNSADHEKKMVSGAVRTDFILSAEIMAIALNEVATEPFLLRALILLVVALAITAGVYGVVGLIVKMDDVGLHLSQRANAGTRALGRGLVRLMPGLMKVLSVVGIAAMIWVGGSIIVHGLAQFGIDQPEHIIHDLAVAAGHAVPAVHGFVEWLVTTAGAGLVGFLLGAAVVAVLHPFVKHKH
ncbi:MAG: putative transport system rane protein [Alphaproteobacteria bacterium]|jgi:predicted DNA repair protein MutK|nr:putative transport system rane protein [Alphaproteobacteria bacterium]